MTSWTIGSFGDGRGRSGRAPKPPGPGRHAPQSQAIRGVWAAWPQAAHQGSVIGFNSWHQLQVMYVAKNASCTRRARAGSSPQASISVPGPVGRPWT